MKMIKRLLFCFCLIMSSDALAAVEFNPQTEAELEAEQNRPAQIEVKQKNSEISPAPTPDPDPVTHKGITLALTLPQPIMLGYEWNYPQLRKLHFFAEGGYFAMAISEKLKKAVGWSVQGGARYFPNGESLYFLGSLGFRQIGLDVNISNLQVDGVPLANTATLRLNAVILCLGVGGQWKLSKKLAFGIDLGVQLPVPFLHWGNTKIVQDASDGTDLSVDDSDALERITNIPVPQIALARFIWYID